MAKAGIFGIGLDTYWDQFEGLRDNLVKYQERIVERIQNTGIQVMDAGLVDNIWKARAAILLQVTWRRKWHGAGSGNG